MIDRKPIEALKHGEHYTIPESECCCSGIWKLNNYYIVFEFPLYGVEPRLVSYSKNIDEIIKTIKNWI